MAGDGASVSALLERDRELGAFEEALARASSGDGGVVVVAGQAGVGKTELLRAAAGLARDAGLHVVRGRGSELDRAFAFGVVRQMLEREVAAAPELLEGGAEHAAAVFSGADAETRAGKGLFAVLQALLWLVTNLAARKPLLLVADDVHWADTPSLRWLVFLAERIEDVPAVVLAATRPSEPGADQELIDALMGAPSARLVSPSPLSAPATATVVRGMLPEADDTFSAACHRATGGNPFLLGELLGELAADGVRGTAADAQNVLEFGPERVGRAVRRRLRLLPAEATAVARAVAVLGPGAPLDEAAALAGLDQAAAGRATDALAGIHVLAADIALDSCTPSCAAPCMTRYRRSNAERSTRQPRPSSRSTEPRASASRVTSCACRDAAMPRV